MPIILSKSKSGYIILLTVEKNRLLWKALTSKTFVAELQICSNLIILSNKQRKIFQLLEINLTIQKLT